MEKQKRWQFFVIVAVLLWTLYNIVPTVLYYSKPLQRPIEKSEAEDITEEIITRINNLEQKSVDWLHSFCSLVGVKPKDIKVDADDSALITLEVFSDQDVEKIKRFLPNAGAHVPFKPAQLYVGESEGHTVQIIRKVGVRLDSKNAEQYFRFLNKRDEGNEITDDYFVLARDRLSEVGYACSGSSLLSKRLESVLTLKEPQAIEALSKDIYEWSIAFEQYPTIRNRLLNTVFQGEKAQVSAEGLVDLFRQEAAKIQVDSQEEFQKDLLRARKERFSSLATWIDGNKQAILKVVPLEKQELIEKIQKGRSQKSRYEFSLENRHPFVRAVAVDWTRDVLILEIHQDILEILEKDETSSEEMACCCDTVKKIMANEMGWLNRQINEEYTLQGSEYKVPLSTASRSNSMIAFSLSAIASDMSKALLSQVKAQWQPESVDLQIEAFPHFNAREYQESSSEEQKLSLVVFSPSQADLGAEELRQGSLYVILKGGMTILKNNMEEVQKDLDILARFLQQRGFVAYSGEVFGLNSTFSQDIIFELDRFYQPVLEATREQFAVPGVVKVGLLECGTREDRILAENRIDDAMQDELIKWRESWQSAQVSLNPTDHFSVPKPPENVFLSNFYRSWKKYWRGDDSRIIRWGLDLSGGKSVRVGLVDQANSPVTKKEDLQQVSSELYTRLNKMGVSERTIRVENDTILIDFPGVHGVTASELIKASAMYFHVVNEKFGPFNSMLASAANAFLQDVWNEAVMKNCKDAECINRMALRRYTAVKSGLLVDDNISLLIENGLVLEDPAFPPSTTAFNDQVSMIARFDSDDEWSNGHPLVFIFKNFALEGCNLDNVHPSYDASKGNILLFGVRGADSRGGDISPREEFYTWTAQFSEEGILGTDREQFSRGHGWRMAVLLNGAVVSAPRLSSPLRDSALISGNFSQRDVQKLSANLQAGSLSFTPKILSEVNVSPELGRSERLQGISAALLAVLTVVVIMIVYYRFAGVVASLAVLGNLIIIWAVMQNIEAAITLPALAGIVLTVAMAVDANVLVFERIREEYAISKRIGVSIARGYQKALSAIVDSNLTTLIAAFILTQFDCGPVRGFALTLIIGLLSSMFTALFVTRYYFTGWATISAHKELKMMDWIQSRNFSFLSWKKLAFSTSLVIIAIGGVCGTYSWRSMLGMDFTGGYALIVEAKGSGEGTPKKLASKAFLAKGLLPSEIQIQELGRPTSLRIQLSASLEEEGRPFYGLPQGTEGVAKFEYQKIPRLEWVVSALQNVGLEIRSADLPNLVQQWTAISGQFSNTMRNNALIALCLSLVAVLVYIAFRFELKYALSAVSALVHDVLITLSIMAVAHVLGFPVQLNLEVIGALMTIVGYSLNDTIIIFDRVREDITLYKKKSFGGIINKALNDTLSRTVMTSLTTLGALFCLVFFGGASIFSFAFVMFVGVLLGTMSSLFIAGPLLAFFHAKEEE